MRELWYGVIPALYSEGIGEGVVGLGLVKTDRSSVLVQKLELLILSLYWSRLRLRLGLGLGLRRVY